MFKIKKKSNQQKSSSNQTDSEDEEDSDDEKITFNKILNEIESSNLPKGLNFLL